MSARAGIAAAEPAAGGTVTLLPDWGERNRQWLLATLTRLRERLGGGDRTDCVTEPGGFVPALIAIGRLFGLSRFERELLLLLAGVELDGELRAATGTDGVGFGAALRLLTEPHWDALSPDVPLRAWRLVAVESGAPLAEARLTIDERILHAVTGVGAADGVLDAVVTRVAPGEVPAGLAFAEPIAAALGDAGAGGTVAILEGGGHDPGYQRDAALAVAAAGARAVLWIAAAELPDDPEALHVLALHLDREALLTGALPVIAAGDAAPIGARLTARMRVPLLWLGDNPAALAGLPAGRRLLRFDLPAPTSADTRAALLRRWRATGARRDDAAMLDQLDRAAAQFRMGPTALDGVVARVRAAPDPVAAVWPAARAAARGGLELLAERIETRVTFDDLVLPAGQVAAIRDIAAHLRQRERVFADWGFGEAHARGQGLVALFTGESGTGKTLAAEAVAQAVGLDLYRVDLATLVSKYIGETEKNLKQLFDAAETSGAVLLFDEADALFGKRSEVKDSHDRYANIEVAYLLQRIEAYRGLAILTTNMKGSIDRAFLRRVRFVVPFPFPDQRAREAIWRRQFPAQAPLGIVDFAALARVALSGGNIRSIAVNAAFKAADAGGTIDQPTLLHATRDELAKLERNATLPGGGA